MQEILQITINGLLYGAVLALVALGIALIFGVMRVVNLAHGEFVVIGAYIGVFTTGSWYGMVGAALAGAVFGFIIQRVIISDRVAGNPLRSVIVTFGLSMTLLGLISVTLGGNPRGYSNGFTPGYEIAGIFVRTERLIAGAAAMLLILALFLFLYRTRVGAGLRAVSQHRDAAAACGVNVKFMDGLAFALASALAVLAGFVLSYQYVTYPNFGNEWLLQSIVVVVLGGLGSVVGAVVAGIALGVWFALGSFFVGSTMSNLLVFSVLFLSLLFRPQGLGGLAVNEERG